MKCLIESNGESIFLNLTYEIKYSNRKSKNKVKRFYERKTIISVTLSSNDEEK